MRQIIVVLGVVLVSIVTGCTSIDAGAAPDVAAEKTAGPTAAASERGFEGTWDLSIVDQRSESLGTMRVERRVFEVDSVHGWYRGTLTIRADVDPPQVDFAIEDCHGCGHQGKTSLGIYYENEDGSIVFSGPIPGDPRSTDFSNKNELWHMWPTTAAAED
jgi:hypothetical protein